MTVLREGRLCCVRDAGAHTDFLEWVAPVRSDRGTPGRGGGPLRSGRPGLGVDAERVAPPVRYVSDQMDALRAIVSGIAAEAFGRDDGRPLAPSERHSRR